MTTSHHSIVRRAAALTLRRGAFVAAFALAVHVAPIPAEVRPNSGTHRPETSRAERLVTRHDCWTGTAPAGVTPTHAVVTMPGDRTRRMSAQVGFDIWVGDHAGVLHAFCP